MRMFSVIIPAYNAESVIQNSINSVLNQTYTNFEVIIVDDGSKDNTRSIIEQYHDKRIKYFFQKNAGVSSARNKGISSSHGEYICFLDADDEWKNNHLETLFMLIQKYGDCGMYITGYELVLTNGQVVHKSQQILKKINSKCFKSDNGFNILLKYGYFFNTNTVCCRREVFDKIGKFEVGIKNGEDDDMWLRIFSYYDIAVSKKSTTIYKRNNSIATKNRIFIKKNVFYERTAELLNSPDISEERKNSIKVWREEHQLSKCRKYILIGRKKIAIDLFSKIDLRLVKKKRYLETLLCFLIPVKVISKIVNNRDKHYFE